jgi:hypothetical protein
VTLLLLVFRKSKVARYFGTANAARLLSAIKAGVLCIAKALL